MPPLCSHPAFPQWTANGISGGPRYQGGPLCPGCGQNSLAPAVRYPVWFHNRSIRPLCGKSPARRLDSVPLKAAASLSLHTRRQALYDKGFAVSPRRSAHVPLGWPDDPMPKTACLGRRDRSRPAPRYRSMDIRLRPPAVSCALALFLPFASRAGAFPGSLYMPWIDPSWRRTRKDPASRPRIRISDSRKHS